MNKQPIKIGVVAPACRLNPAAAEKVQAIAAESYPGGRVELLIHPQCYLSDGHFAGDDAARAAAFLEVANDPTVDAVWFARGGYGACRILDAVIPDLAPAAKAKTYLGYSDMGSLLGALYRQGFAHLAHGPMVSDVRREGGEVAARRALAWLVDRDAGALEPSLAGGQKAAAFNITILAALTRPSAGSPAFAWVAAATSLPMTRISSAPRSKWSPIGAPAPASPISAARTSATTWTTASCRLGRAVSDKVAATQTRILDRHPRACPGGGGTRTGRRQHRRVDFTACVPLPPGQARW